jgi:serine protease AprX
MLATSSRRGVVRGLAVLAAASFAAFVCAGVSWGTGVPRPGPSAAVIVQALPGSEQRAELAVARLGGRLKLRLPIVNGFSARVPRSALGSLRSLPFIASVTLDSVVRAQGASYSPASDTGSLVNTTLITGAQAYWKAGYTGKGVDVALIDSGVVPVDGLTVPGKVVNGPDLSFESQAPSLGYLDSFGHGTHMAGIIAGRAGAAVQGSYVGDQTNFLGMAPDSRIVSLKVADAHGATDVSQLIAAIDWVVQHKNDNGLNIRVLNLSYGTDSAQSYALDPLAYAAEQAWKAGIVVVAAAGNAGWVQHVGSMTDPATDPFVIAVGAEDTMGTNSTTDDVVASFSANGSSSRMPDVTAPGVHIVSLRDPGSLIDQTYGRTGYVTDGLFRGSGTSQAAAVVSGAAALIIQQRPSITPDQLKSLLVQTATTPFQSSSKFSRGGGEINLTAALTAATPTKAAQKVTASTGTGLLELARGSTHLVKDGVTLLGEKDIFGQSFAAAAMAKLEASAKSWSAGTWNGSSWSGSSWSGSSWSGSSWSGSSWSGSSWSGSSWSAVLWSASSWSGSSWSSSSWSDNNWLDSGWADNAWADASWS